MQEIVWKDFLNEERNKQINRMIKRKLIITKRQTANKTAGKINVNPRYGTQEGPIKLGGPT